MPTTQWNEATRGELYVRSDLPAPAQQCQTSIVARLEDAVASGALEEFSVTSWAKRVPFDPEYDAGEFERSRYERFREWADDADVSLTPCFDTRECYCWITGERRTELVLPAACIALYDGDDVVSVVPNAREGETVTVWECLDALTARGSDEPAQPLTTAD